MPKATVSTEAEHFELKTLEGAWVDLKRLSFGQKLERQQMATDLLVKMEGKGGGKKTGSMEAKMDLMTDKVTQFDFRHCIVDHNLEADDEGTKLVLTNPKDVALLDPRVGEEIQTLIDSINNLDEDDEGGN